MKKLLLQMLIILSPLFASVLRAQSASITWSLTANANVSSTSGSIGGDAQSLSGMEINSYQAVAGSGTGNSQLSRITGGSWPAESAQNDGRYVQFAVRPATGYKFNATSITLYYGGKGGGNVKGNIAYSVNADFSSSTRLNATTLAISSSAGTMQQLSYSPGAVVDTGKTLYLRVFPWYTSASTGKYLCLQNVVISGTTESTSGIAPTVTTASVTNIGGTTADGGGTISDSGSAGVTARGVCWNTALNPVITDAHTNDGTGIGPFTSALTGLLPNTTYHVRAYAQNTIGVNYGSDVSFTTATIAPTVTTAAPEYLGLTSLTVGGNVTSTGGTTVTARGVCWSTNPNPTLSDSVTTNGTGAGSFSSPISGLSAGTTYHYRAYATNSIGTNYGGDSTVTTLSSALLPTVTTTNAGNLSPHAASVIGNVSYDGGISLTARGICWNKTGSPTIDTNATIEGTGMGLFGSYLQNLDSAATYYVRAYATNSVGTAYGNQISFTTLMPSSSIIVAADGSGNFLTVGEALKAIPNTPAVKTTVWIKKGIYFEKDTMQNCSNVLVQGEDRDSTIIRYDDYTGRVVGGTTIGTSTSQTFWVRSSANDITFHNLTIQNTSTAAQAVALNIQGDRIHLINCKLLGYQDTYYTWGTGRSYHKNCYIQGSVDFIFGSGIAVFDNCTINLNRNGGTITAASTPAGNKYGYVFRNCTITADAIGFDSNPITSFYLGRPWQNAPKTVFMNSVEPATLHSAGWLAWNVSPALYAEYNCSGPGSGTGSRVAWSSQLTATEASEYTLANMFAKNSANPAYASDWYPNDGMLPVELSSFNARVSGQSVYLTWETQTEKNSAAFYVERTNRAEEGEWVEIGQIKASGYSNAPKNYSFTDDNVPAGNFTYRLKIVDNDGSFEYSTGIEISVAAPSRYELGRNYPNPFNPSTRISFQIPEKVSVELKIYNQLGEQVALLLNNEYESGSHSVEWNAAGFPSGIYFCEMRAKNFTSVRKLVLLK